MNDNSITIEVVEPVKQVELPSIGLGTLRTSGTYIAALLQLEPVSQRPTILVDVARKLGIPLEEIVDTYNDKACPHCGISLKAHKQNGGECF